MKGNSIAANNNRMTPIAAAVAILAMTVAMSAQAQQAAKQDDGSTVVVTGIRASLQQSLNQKKNAESLVEVITAEDIGKMPDKNVADSLSRVPGVTTTSAGSAEGSFGENEHVQLRGMSSQMTLTTLNGHTVSTGDWYGPNMAAGGRSVTYTLLPSDLVGRIVVHKSSQADLVEGGAAGTVDVQTRRPLEFKEHLTASASIEGAYSTAAKSTDPSLSAMVAWKNDDNTFGLLAQVFSQQRKLQRAGSEGVWWDTVPANNAEASLRGLDISRLSGATLFEQERKREGGFFAAQWKPAGNVTLDFSAFQSKLNATNTNTNYMAAVYPNVFAKTPTTAPTIVGKTITAINYGPTAGGAGDFSVVEDVAARPDAKTDSNFYNFDAKWVVNPDLTVTSKVGYTNGGGSATDVGFEVLSAWKGAGYSVTKDGVFVLNVPGGDKWTKGGNTIGGWGSRSKSKDSETYAQADGDLKLASDMVPSIKFGARFTKHERDYTKLNVTYKPGSTDENQVPDSAVGNYPSKWYGDLPTNPTPGFSPFKISRDYVFSWTDKYATFVTHATGSEYNVQEKTSGAYLMANLQPAENISGNIGLRVVKTNMEIRGALPLIEQSYTDVLPSFNLRADLVKDLVARVAINRGLSRQDFGQLGGAELKDTQHEGSSGNPTLKPIRSNNFDVSLEWYFAPKAMLQGGFFMSNLDGAPAYGKSVLPFPDASNGNKITDYTVSTTLNSKGEMKGFDLAYEQGLWGGFGISANYTYADGKLTKTLGTCNGTATQDCSLYGTSKQSYNVGGFYEDDRFSARLSYSHRTNYKLGNNGGADYFQGENGSLNAAVNYTFNKNLQFSLEAQNLTDPLMKVYKNNYDTIAGVYKNGMTVYGGLRLKF